MKPKSQSGTQSLAESKSGLHYAPPNRIFKMETVELFLLLHFRHLEYMWIFLEPRMIITFFKRRLKA